MNTFSTQRPLFSQATTPLLIILLTLASITTACSSSSSSPPEHTFEGEACNGVVATTTRASADVRSNTNVDSYDIRVDDDGYHIDLLDKQGKSIGMLRTQIEIDFSLPNQWTVHSWLTEDKDHQIPTASQTIHTQALAGKRMRLETKNKIFSTDINNESIAWFTIDEDLKVHDMAFGIPIDNATLPTQITTLHGDFEVLNTYTDGERLPDDQIKTWAQENNLDTLTKDPAWQLFLHVSNDLNWRAASDQQLARCQSFEFENSSYLPPPTSTKDTNDTETTTQPLCQHNHPTTNTDSETQSKTQALCGMATEDVLKTVLNFNDAWGAAGAGGTIAVSLAMGGVIGTGFGFGVVIIGSAVVVWAAGNAIDNFVNNNKRTVVEATVWVGGGLKDRNRSDNSAVVDFFAPAGSTGDPHIDTFDKLAYNFQAAGEFILFRSTNPDSTMQVQVRQEPISGICSNVSINTAVAAQIGTDRIAIYKNAPDTLHVNGRPIALPGGSITLAGGLIERTKPGFNIIWNDGSAMKISARTDPRVALTSAHQNAVQGLLGNFNGNRTDDFQLDDGTIFEHPIAWDDLVTTFADAWRVTTQTSLFDYESGKNTDAYAIAGFPDSPTDLSSLPQERQDTALQTCRNAGIENPIVLNACALDIACTGDDDFANAHASRVPEELAKTDGSDPTDPTDSITGLADWYSPLSGTDNRFWTVAPDKQSVTTAPHIDELVSFLITNEPYQNVKVTGTFKVDITTPEDDDLNGTMGFAFGLQSPTTDGQNTIQSFIFSWRSVLIDPDSPSIIPIDFTAQPGMTLFHLNSANLTDNNIFRGLLASESETGKHVLATNLGPNKGWTHRQEHQFELIYTTEKIEISIDGTQVFSILQSESPIPFEPGRFGLYNFGQTDTTYANITITTLP